MNGLWAAVAALAALIGSAKFGPRGTSLMVDDTHLHVTMRGLDVLWSFRRRLRFPIENVLSAAPYRDWESVPKPTIRTGGTGIPGVVIAGRFRGGGTRQFWNVHNRRDASVIRLQNERFDFLVLQPSSEAEAKEVLRRWPTPATGEQST